MADIIPESCMGDSVYAAFDDNCYLRICTNNGMGSENIIYLEDPVADKLLIFIVTGRARINEIRRENAERSPS